MITAEARLGVGGRHGSYSVLLRNQSEARQTRQVETSPVLPQEIAETPKLVGLTAVLKPLPHRPGFQNCSSNLHHVQILYTSSPLGRGPDDQGIWVGCPAGAIFLSVLPNIHTGG